MQIWFYHTHLGAKNQQRKNEDTDIKDLTKGGKYTYIDLNASESEDQSIDKLEISNQVNSVFKDAKLRKLSEISPNVAKRATFKSAANSDKKMPSPDSNRKY